MAAADTALHTRARLPPQLLANVGKWSQHELTPGWRRSLPVAVAGLCAKWGIELDAVIPETYLTLVLLGHSVELGPVAIKSSPLAALGNVARLYDVDFERGIMVLERIVPGTQLLDVAMRDEDAAGLAAQTAATMWRPAPDPAGLHPVRRWVRAPFAWSPRSDRIAPDLLQHAQQLAASLLAPSSRPPLLHGDFQHHNVLRRALCDWAIIDPKGLCGDPGFEIAAWMCNRRA